MEALAILIAILAFIALLSDEIKPPPPSPGDQFVKGLKAVVKDIKQDLEGGGPKKTTPGFLSNPFSVILYAILIGILVTFI